MAAVTILVIITVSILTITDKCVESMIDNELKIQAFKIARQNMESLLSESSVSEMIEFGSLEENPGIEWELKVEASMDTPGNEWWLKAISTASYPSPGGDREYIELTHWLTDLTDAQVKQIEKQRQLELEFMDEIIENPYGDDPEGLMMFQESLASDGKFKQAAMAALDLLKKHPNSEEAIDAATNARMYARKTASFGDQGTAADIVIEIATLIDDPAIEKLCLDDAMKYANDAAKSGDFREAAEIAKKISEEFPDSPKAEIALKYAFGCAQAAAAAGDYIAATDIIDEFPESQLPPDIAKAREDDGWDDKAAVQPEENPNNVPQKSPLTPDQYAKLIEDYKNGNVSMDDLNNMVATGQLKPEQLFPIILSPLSK